MKKIFTLFLALICVVGLVGCNKGSETMYQLGIIVDGVFYEKSFQPMPAEIDESAIIGYIQSYSDTFPTKDGETNISKDLIDTPYAKVEGGIAVLYENKWYLCVAPTAENTNRSLDNIIENEPSITGVVTEVYENSFLMLGEPTEGYPTAEEYSVSLKVENKDSYTTVAVGDEVIVYHNGEIAESAPLQINTVYAITLKTPATKSSIDENLSAFIGSKITEHHETEQSSQNFRALDFAVLDMNNADNVTTVYLWVLYEEYSYANDLQLETGVHIPTIITVKQVGNAYELVEYWEPRDGAYYTEDIKEKFPSHLQSKVFNSQDYIDVLKAECERQALEHFNLTADLPNEIPGLTIAYGEEEITAWLGGHSWIYEDDKGEKNAIIKESNHPLHCMETMSFIPVYATTVSHAVGHEPGQVTLNFDVEPTKITVYRYDVEAADEAAGEEIIMDNGYVLDLAFGNYLYHIAAEWDSPDKELGGSGDYAFYTKAPEIHNPQTE